MAKLVVFLSLLLVLCCVTLVSCKASSSNPPPANPTEFIQLCCQRTMIERIIDLCTKDLTPFASEFKGDNKRLAMKAVSISKDKVKSSLKLLKKLKHDKKTTTTDGAAKAVDSCTLNFMQSAEQIAWAEGSLKSMGQPKSNNSNKENVSNWLRNSQVNASACAYTMSSFKDTNLGDAYNNLNEATDTISYADQLVSVYFETLPRPPPQPKYAGSQDPLADFIRDTCNVATPSLASQCEDDLLPVVPKGGAKMDENTIAFLEVNVSIRKANALISYMNDIISNNNTTQKDRQAAQKCVGGVHTAFIPLDKLDDENPSGLEDLTGFLEGMVASEGVCLDLAKTFEVNATSVVDKANDPWLSSMIALKLVEVAQSP